MERPGRLELKVENIFEKRRTKIKNMNMKILNFLSKKLQLKNLITKISILSCHENMLLFLFYLFIFTEIALFSLSNKNRKHEF